MQRATTLRLLVAAAMVSSVAATAAGASAGAASHHHKPSHGFNSEFNTYTVPSTVDPTGTLDVTAALQNYLNGVPDGSTIAFPKDAKYRVEGTLTLTDRHDLVIQGNGATVFATTTGTRNRSQWCFLGGDGITVNNLVVRGANPDGGLADDAYQSALEAQHGFNVLGSANVVLNKVTVTDTYGDFVYLGIDPRNHLPARSVRVDDSTFARSGRQGLTAADATGVRFDHNLITDTRRATFDLEPDGKHWVDDQIQIDHNLVGPGRLLFVAAAGAGPVNDVTVLDNVLRGRNLTIAVDTPSGQRRSNWVIKGNNSDKTFGSPLGAAIILKGVDRATVSGNDQALQKGRNMAGVLAHQSCDVNVANNVFTNATSAERVEAPSDTCAPPAARSTS